MLQSLTIGEEIACGEVVPGATHGPGVGSRGAVIFRIKPKIAFKIFVVCWLKFYLSEGKEKRYWRQNTKAAPRMPSLSMPRNKKRK